MIGLLDDQPKLSAYLKTLGLSHQKHKFSLVLLKSFKASVIMALKDIFAEELTQDKIEGWTALMDFAVREMSSQMLENEGCFTKEIKQEEVKAKDSEPSEIQDITIRESEMLAQEDIDAFTEHLRANSTDYFDDFQAF